MSNPSIRGTPTVWPDGPAQSPDHVTSLANGQALGLGKLWAENIGLATPFGDLILPPWKITTGSGSVSGTISRYLILSEDGTLWTGGVDPTSNSDQSTALAAMLAYDGTNASLIDSITVAAASTAYYFRWRSLQSMLGNLPHYASVLIYNQSGRALSATAAPHTVQYVSESYA
jgi:hypothetical protein